MFIYDIITNNWTNVPAMPIEGGSPAANFVANKLYIIGGDSHDDALATVERYDPMTRNWTILSDMPTGRHHAAYAVVTGEIYVIGGRITESLVMSIL